MASLKEVKTRINSVKSTRKITSAMKMVASAKLHKAQGAIENMLPYQKKLNKILTNFLSADLPIESPYVQEREVKRVAIVYGKALPGQHGNIVQLVMNRLKAGQEIRVVSDQWRTPTYVGDVSDGVLRLIEHTANGIFHICGDECMTIAEIAYQVADYMKLDRSLIHPATTEKMNESTPRPRFSGMSIDKSRTMLGYRPQKLKEILANWDKL